MNRLIWVLSGCALLAASVAWGQPASQSDLAGQAVECWQEIRRADLESRRFSVARMKIEAIVKDLPRSDRVRVLAGMMDPSADASVNSAGLALFGEDPIGAEDIRAILEDAARSDGQREVLKTTYGLCAQDPGGAKLSGKTRLALVDLLAERLEKLRGQVLSHEEQRLLTNLCQDALGGCEADSERPVEARRLHEALRTYADRAPASDVFGASIRGWLAIAESRVPSAEDPAGALARLGHWSALARWQAASSLAGHASRESSVLSDVWTALADDRDEVRAAAVRVFAFAPDLARDSVVPQMVAFLVEDRSTLVQEAAAEVLIARADQAANVVDPLLQVFQNRKCSARRSSCILEVLAALVPPADSAQRQRILAAAVERLAMAPDGALAALKALGPTATNAADAVKAYRLVAYRPTRVYIDRHVLPVILDAGGGN